MKVGTDGILLGAWAQAEQPQRILDIGTGTGLIALMMAKRFPNAIVDSVEIESNAAEQELGRFFNKRFLTPFCRFCRSFLSLDTFFRSSVSVFHFRTSIQLPTALAEPVAHRCDFNRQRHPAGFNREPSSTRSRFSGPLKLAVFPEVL